MQPKEPRRCLIGEAVAALRVLGDRQPLERGQSKRCFYRLSFLRRLLAPTDKASHDDCAAKDRQSRVHLCSSFLDDLARSGRVPERPSAVGAENQSSDSASKHLRFEQAPTYFGFGQPLQRQCWTTPYSEPLVTQMGRRSGALAELIHTYT